MRTSLLSFVFVVTHLFIKAQDATETAQSDTVQSDTVQMNVVQVTPYYSHELTTSSNYVKKMDSPDLLRFSSGVSIFNSLRGQVPAFSVSPYFNQANASGIRTGPYPFTSQALIVIDGVPFNNYIGNYLNLNSFEFSSISAFSNTSALNFLGGINSGAFVLASKTGEGVTEPLFEFNTYATYGWGEVANLQNGLTDKKGEWDLTNAIAYSQDYGVIDTRISYTIQKKFFQSYAEPYFHNLKVNTGLMASEKFDLRLIVDGRYSRYADTFLSRGLQGPTNTNQTASDFFANGNLVARYKFAQWLVATSQLTLSRYESDSKKTGSDWGLVAKTTNSRQQVNFFLNGSKKIGRNLNISGLTGIQYVRQNIEEFQSRYGPFTREFEDQINLEDKNPALLAQASFNYHDVFVLSAHYRSGTHINLRNDKKPVRAHFVASSFIFSELIGKSLLSFGKLRASMGARTVTSFNSYPIINTDYVLFPPDKQSLYYVRNLEAGLDIGFLNSRLMLTVNYFKNREVYDMPYGVIITVDQYLNRGWESEIRYKTVKKNTRSFESGIVLSNTKSRIDLKTSKGGDYGKPFLRTGWFNQLNHKSIILTILIESENNYTGYYSNTGFIKSSFTKLRDVSLGIRLPKTWFISTLSKGATFSLSGRNLIKLSGSGTDLEETSGFPIFEKSMSMSLNVIF